MPNEYITLYSIENEVNTLTDEEFAVFQEKLRCTHSPPCTGNTEFHRFFSGKTEAELSDEDLGLYRCVVVSSPRLFGTMYGVFQGILILRIPRDFSYLRYRMRSPDAGTHADVRAGNDLHRH